MGCLLLKETRNKKMKTFSQLEKINKKQLNLLMLRFGSDKLAIKFIHMGFNVHITICNATTLENYFKFDYSTYMKINFELFNKKFVGHGLVGDLFTLKNNNVKTIYRNK
jgi:hypothetical protein